MATYLIIDNSDKSFVYDKTNLALALDAYIKEQVKFEDGFNLSESTWLSVKNNLSSSITIPNRVAVINGFCKRDKFKIKKIFSGCVSEYSS